MHSQEVRLDSRTAVPSSEGDVDAALQRATEASLAGREGTIIALDPETGRVRAVANREIAFGRAYPPGSTVKPFTLLAALRSGVVKPASRLSCRQPYERGDFSIRCSHPPDQPPLDAAGALAHSCNYYFAKLGERAPSDEFDHTLAAYGLGGRAQRHHPSGPAPASANRVSGRGPWHVRAALGEGGRLLVTPAQLLAAYAALVNGGRVFALRQPATPEAARSSRPEAVAVHAPPLAPEERDAIFDGMREAVERGTASAVGFASLPFRVVGKTGTATEVGDFRTHGWFVGLALEGDQVEDKLATGRRGAGIEPPAARLSVLVFLRRGTGAESAQIARQVFAVYARSASASQSGEPTGAASDDVLYAPPLIDAARAPRDVSPRQVAHVSVVRVRLTRAGVTKTLSLEDYLFGALAAEASTEDEFAALKAQAVTSRTYALDNLRRHAREGFDFCDLTHCQRFLRVTAENARPQFHATLRRALRETEGEVILGPRGSLAHAYFSASCGGATANVEALWGTPAREIYERGVADESCAADARHSWQDEISTAELLRALRGDARTAGVGSRLDGVAVVKRDASGRAELVQLDGERRLVVRGWDFKIVVGRTLGWNLLRSSRFEVTRRGAGFVFSGRGFGHGLGLCQAGAHSLARRGADYREIVRHNFPGARLSRLNGGTWRAEAHQAGRARSSTEPEAQMMTVGAGLVPARSERKLARQVSFMREVNSSHVVTALSPGGQGQARPLQPIVSPP
ncbi:MAG: SpoIID/LytB domain-containing protein, partial [Pyrinomonadaceae bacterium]